MNNIVSKYFDSISAKQWKQKIQYLLNGKNYQSIVHNNVDGVSTLPFYTKKNQTTLKKSLLEEKCNPPKPTYYCVVNSAEQANKEALFAIQHNVTTIYFAVFDSKLSLNMLLKNIDITVIIQCYFLDSNFGKHANLKTKNCTILFDYLNKISKTGNWYTSAKEDFKELNKALRLQNNNLSINLSSLHNAGASPVQQLSYGLSQLISYTKHIQCNSKQPITYLISVSTNIYLEIAKIKALRILHKHIASTRNLPTSCCIIQFKCKRNLSGLSGEINNVNAYTEKFIAQLGGVDYYTSMPKNYYFYKEDIPQFDSLLKTLITQNSCINNFSENVIYIEKLTEQLVEKSLVLIETLENGGGYIEQLKKGIIQQKIALNENKESKMLHAQIGLNNIKEGTYLHKTPVSYPFLKKNKRKALWQPIIEKQWRAPLEIPLWKEKFDA